MEEPHVVLAAVGRSEKGDDANMRHTEGQEVELVEMEASQEMEVMLALGIEWKDECGDSAGKWGRLVKILEGR